MNKYKFKAITTSIMSVFNIFISIVLAKKYGAIGCAIGTSISLIICNIFVMNIYYYRCIHLNVIYFWKEIFKMTIILVLPAIGMFYLKNILNISEMFGIILSAIIYCILYVILCKFFVINDYEKMLLKKILRKEKK